MKKYRKRKTYSRFIPSGCKLLEAYKDKHNTRILYYTDENGIKHLVVESSCSRPDINSSAEFLDGPCYIFGFVMCYSECLSVLSENKCALRWFKKRALKFTYQGRTIKDFLKTSGNIDWEKAKEGGN